MFFGATALFAQELRVRVKPDSVYLGDAFQVEASVDNAELESISCSFATPAQVIGQSTSVSITNGHVSSLRSVQVLPKAIGECRLDSVTAVTKEGRTLTYSQPLTVQVRELKPDGSVFLESSVAPEAPLPGDEVVVTLVVRAPAIRDGERLVSPFLETTFFGQVQERIPRLQFEVATSEDAPLRQLEQPRLVSREADGDNLVWKIVCKYRAVRVGEQTFPAPLIRDTRYFVPAQGGQLQETRCMVMGNPITVRVEAPPTEGRPEGFTGAIGSRFSADVTLDALNVKVGDPVKLTIALLSDGDPELLRAPRLPEFKGFRAYGEPVRNTLEGGYAFVYNLRPLRAGLLEIPPLTFAWFEKATRTYQVEHSVAVPLYVHPSAQLVLLGEDGEALSDILPPALQLTSTVQPTFQPSLLALFSLLFGCVALLGRLFFTPARRLWYRIVQRLTHKRPVRRVCATLRRVQTAAEALNAIRIWTARPALTSTELRNLLEETPEAQAVVAAVAQLEYTLYSGGGDVPEAREALVNLLPQVTFRRTGGHANGAMMVFLLLLLPGLLVAESDSFLLEQAEALSISANTPADYAEATDLWLRLAREGNPSANVLLNAASCAVFARHPSVAQRLIARYEVLYGRSPESEQVVLAVADRLDEPYFWGRTLFAPHYDWALNKRIEGLCYAVGLFLLLCALPWRRLRGARILTGLCVVIIMMSVLISLANLSQPGCYDALPEAIEEEVAP